ncbi:uncharacterized protein LOC128033881 [Gossypium raimondii]|uniref:uncharacterized protein LOC128033881 n=1 Tax=Gossypium raimondii TaxID=29730 RepID=UPI00227D1BC5|nr:uncharacterized protein LOC128033881 [Gossypium raimondii]
MNGEMIENTIRSGKIDAGESNRRSASKRKENKVNNASMYSKGYSRSVTVSQPRKVVANQQSSSRQEAGTRLIGMGVVKFDEVAKTENPLPNHTDSRINMMDENRRIKTDIADVKTPLRWECTEFRAMVQGMMDNKEMEFCEGVQRESHICASESALGVPKANHPVVIISRPQNSEVGARVTPKVIIQRPTVFAYKDNMRVPWNYNCNVTIPGKEDTISKEDQDEGRHYEQMKARVEPIREEASAGKKRNAVEPELLVNEPIKEGEAREFLKFLKHSEYRVLEQLHKQPARISVLALLLNSEGHRNALLKVLNETYVADDISVNKLDRLVGNISTDNFIFFSDVEIPPGGMRSTRALHITTRCKGYTLVGVLVDNGSALNVLPLSTLNRLPVDRSHMKSCQNVVRAFDGTKRRVMGRIDIPLLIGPTVYEVDFLVMDIKPSFNCLLGRPWIHSAGAIPSSLHQKLELVSEGRLVTINAKEDIIASVTNDAPYLEASDDAIQCSFRSLEFVNATLILEGNKIPTPRILKTTKMGLQLTVGKGALLEKGLGKYLQGRVEAPVLKDKQDRFGLGYKPDTRQRRIE